MVKIGWSRQGMIWQDLTEWPHLLVAGQTFGGKSNFLHWLLIQLTNCDNVKLFVIDLKRMEFELYKNHALVSYRLPEAIKTLEYLHREMQRRMDFLASHGCVKIQDYEGELPFNILVVDEFSQLCPQLATGEDDKKMRKYAHSLLVDLICLARALGEHIIISTQRPDADILPGQLKANIPASIVFKVRNGVNSRICLDNDKAAYLPDIKGRCIYQFQKEIELQVPYVNIKQIPLLLPSEPMTKPEIEADSKPTQKLT
jgi:S-DNA-T family DNA segregation ATPase FtsK/SpoIIIE